MADTAWLESLAILREFGSDADAGLTHLEASRRLRLTGPNELVDKPREPAWRRFLAQFANTMIIVLVGAAAVTLAVGAWRDATVIIAILVLNAAIGFIQESRAERAVTALTAMTSPSARVVREGAQIALPARDLVPGDVILVEAGDVIPADARLLECAALRVDEAALTGESIPVDKSTASVAEPAESVADQTNMVFRGTAVVHGRGRAVVVATGMATAVGKIASLLRSHRAPPTPLQLRLAHLGRRLAAAAVVVCALVFALGLVRHEDPLVMFLTAVSLAVAAIPEALPAVVTIALALGAQRMARRHALVRQLPAVETLGSVTVICTDKTGTLTEGRMQVERIWTHQRDLVVTGHGYKPQGAFVDSGGTVDPSTDRAASQLLLAAALCNDAVLVPPGDADGDWTVVGDPTEGALLVAAAKAGIREPARAYPRVAELPFDTTRRRMTTVHEGVDGNDGTTTARLMICTKGAIEALLDVSSALASLPSPVPLDAVRRAHVLAQAERYAADGYRVLAVAGRLAGQAKEELESDLVLYGLVAMADPPRPESRDAVQACRRAGIRPVMITGDHPATALAIAARMGIDDHGEVMTGAMLQAEGPGALAKQVERVSVFARTSPEQKLGIVEAWQACGHVVAMTGDGVNDAPALRRADIGVAMGVAGTDVAREAAAIVLEDDNFATIVAAVAEGRRIHDNVRRFVRYTLTSNAGEIWVMLLGPLVGLSLPLLAVQILWINLITDGLPGLALAVEPAEHDVLKRPPRPPGESVFARGMWQHVLLVGLLMGTIPLALGVWGAHTGRPWQTMVFTSLAVLQLGHALGVRSEHQSLRRLGLRTNKPMLAAVIGTLCLQLAVVYTTWGQTLFHIQPLARLDLIAVLLASTGALVAVEAEKAIRRARSSTSDAGANE